MPEEETKEQVKEEEKVVVMTTDMHCHACQEKINKVLKNFPGVEKIDLDVRERKVTVKGKIDAKSVYEAVKRKCGKRTHLVFPQLSEDDEQNKDGEKEKPNDDVPPDVVVGLKIKMHCGACAREIKKILLKVPGVIEVLEDRVKDKVVVKGKGLDAEVLCTKVRKLGKHCQIIPPPPPPQKEESKEEPVKVEEVKADVKATEEKNEAKTEEKQEENGSEVKFEIKKYVYPQYQNVHHHYVYPPQLFSDENPNACNVM